MVEKTKGVNVGATDMQNYASDMKGIFRLNGNG
jgi:hypothetical protein